jgi:long-subunit acyl-CoA synthetase (AMP-forming)
MTTYEELKTSVASLAEALSSLGASPQKEPVLLLMDNSPIFLECFLACGTTGIVAVPVEPKLWPEDIAAIAERSHACIAITSSAHLGALALCPERAPRLKTIIVTDLLGRSGIVGLQFVPLLGLRARFAGSHAFYDANVPSNNDIASLIFTSGALIKPKRFHLTQSSFWHDNVRGSTGVLNKLTQSDHYLVTPLFKPFDFLSNIVLPIRNGARISFARSSSTVKEDAAALHPTIVMADPDFAERIVDRLDARFERHILAKILMKCGFGRFVGRQVVRSMGGRLRYVIVDDAPCSVRVREMFKRLGIGLVEP